VLRDLHWLPVASRIEYKVALITHKVQHHEQPHYLSELVDAYQPSRTLRSSSQHLLTKPTGIKTKLGQRCFTHPAAATWNSLPAELRVIKDERLFKSKLKLIYFPITMVIKLILFIYNLLHFKHLGIILWVTYGALEVLQTDT